MLSFKDSSVDDSTAPLLVTLCFFLINSSKAFYETKKRDEMDNKTLMVFSTVPCKNLMTEEKPHANGNIIISDERIFNLLHKFTWETTFPIKKWNKPEPDHSLYQE